MEPLEIDASGQQQSPGGRGRHTAGRPGGVSLITRVRHTPSVATAVIGFSFFSDYILLLMMVPILPLYGTELGLSNTAIGIMFGVKPFAQMFANPVMGFICDRIGTRVPMVAALCFLSVATMLFAFAETYALLVLARILQGVASSGNVVAGMAHLSKLFSGKYSERRGAQIGRAAVGISLGVMAGAPVGGILFAAGGKRLPFLVVSGVLVIDAVARILLLAEPDEVHAALAEAEPETDSDLELAGTNTAAAGKRGGDGDARKGSAGPGDDTVALTQHDAVAAGVLKAGGASSGGSDSDVGELAAINGVDAAPAPGADNAASATPGASSDLVVVRLAGDGSPNAGVGGSGDSDAGGDSTELHKAADDASNLSTMAMLGRLIRDGQVMSLTMVLMLGNGGIGFIEAQFPLYLADTFGLNSLKIGLIYGAQTMLFTMVMPTLAARGHRIGRPLLMGAGLVLMGTFIPVISVVKHLAWVVPNWMGTAVGMACIDSSCNPQLADIVEQRHPGCYGKAFALANTGTSLGFTLAPIIGGYIVDHGGFGLAALLIGLCLVVYVPVVMTVFSAWPCGAACCARRPQGMQRLEEAT